MVTFLLTIIKICLAIIVCGVIPLGLLALVLVLALRMLDR